MRNDDELNKNTVQYYNSTSTTNKQYNCPDCQRTDSCDGCFRISNGTININIFPMQQYIDKNIWDGIPDACRRCSGHPSNGGSGICNCILGCKTIY